jgi:hypothetical protein
LVRSSAIVSIWNVPQRPMVKDMVPSLVLLGSGEKNLKVGPSRRYQVTGHVPSKGTMCASLLFSLLSSCHEESSLLHHALLP